MKEKNEETIIKNMVNLDIGFFNNTFITDGYILNIMETLAQFVENIWIVDTHEHLVQENGRVTMEADPLQTFLLQYTSSDLISAGLKVEDYATIMNSTIPIEERWTILEPFWEKASNTGYFDVLRIAANDLYGVDDINEKTIKRLKEKMDETNKIGLYKWVLKDKAKIEIAILDPINDNIEVDRSFFAPVVRLEDFIILRSREDVRRLSMLTQTPIHSLRDLERAIEGRVESILGQIVGFKIALAYKRSIYFDNVTSSEAEKVLNKILGSKETFHRYTRPDGVRVTVSDEISIEEGKPLQDYMVHKMIQLASKYSLPVQVHTGIQEGNLNNPSNSNPVLLANLFMEYPEVKFDVFHSAYPYTKEIATLCKNLPNVYVDLCWLHVISPFSAREVLSDLLDTVPANKIFGFGGDYKFVEGIYGHSRIARKNIIKVLEQKVQEGRFNEERAKKIASMILHDNILEVFKKIRT
ncbi:MAG: amidohydrolase family protein [Nitrososphaeria archaeon]